MNNFVTPKKLVTGEDISKPLHIPASPLLKQLGYGTGVQVYRFARSPHAGKMSSPWALKYITKRKMLQVDCPVINKRLSNEADILKKLNHPNIVGFRAFSNLPDGRKVLAMEDCEVSLGDLIEIRQESNGGPFAATHILKMISDMAAALNYLHNDMLLLHGDIKSHNILIKGDFIICKLCDFGVSVPLDRNGVILPNYYYHGTELWSAPETLEECEITSKADMFALGLSIWEMISLQPPHIESCTEKLEESSIQLDESNDDNFRENIDSKLGTRPDLPNIIFEKEYYPVLECFYILTEQCSQDRPSASLLVQLLGKICIV